MKKQDNEKLLGREKETAAEEEARAADAAEPAGKEAGEAVVEEESGEKNELEALQEQYQALSDQHLRLMAEYDNFRKRTQKEKDDLYPAATANALAKFLPILDSMERASQFDYKADEFARGFEMILQNCKDMLAGFGVEEIGKVGETFDPMFHNAVMHVEDESLGTNVISQVLQKGYKMGDRVIRYAMVQTAN